MTKREPVEYKREKAPVTVKCNQCGRAVGKGKPVRLWREEVTFFRGDDVMHWRCPECHNKADTKDPTP